MSLLVYLEVIPYTKFENFGIFPFSYAAEKQTNRETDGLDRKSYQRRPTQSAWATR